VKSELVRTGVWAGAALLLAIFFSLRRLARERLRIAPERLKSRGEEEGR
jgi:hypothetical protein